MPVSAHTLRLLMEAGLAGDALLAIVEQIDTDMAATGPAVERTAAAVRQQRYRARKKEAEQSQQSVTRDVTRDVTTSVTTPLPHTPSEIITPQKKTPPTEGQKKRGDSKGSRFPDGWSLGEKERSEATSVGLPSQFHDREFAKFRDWAIGAAGPKGVKRDWSAAWRNWCRTAAERLPTGVGPPPPAAPGEDAAKWRAMWALGGVERDTPAEPARREDWKDLLAYWFATARWPCSGPDPKHPQCPIPADAVQRYADKFGWLAPKIRAEEAA